MIINDKSRNLNDLLRVFKGWEDEQSFRSDIHLTESNPPSSTS